jgi:hypothetical protein
MFCKPQALEFRIPLFPHLVPPAIMVWIFVWKYIFEPFIHILQRLAGIRTKTSFVMLMLQSWHYVRLLHGFIVYHIYITLNMQFVNYHIVELSHF